MNKKIPKEPELEKEELITTEVSEEPKAKNFIVTGKQIGRAHV